MNETQDPETDVELQVIRLEAPLRGAVETAADDHPDPGHSARNFADLLVAVLIPCHNEETTVATVVRGFRRSLPHAEIYVYDNASTDRTREEALAAGATWRPAPKLGKGNVLRRMFAEVDADVYVIADGDDTYDAAAAPLLVGWLREHRLDMVVGRRVEAERADAAYRYGHRLGNRMLTRSVHWLFGDGSADMLSGYRVVTRRYAKSFPARSRGFEVETEMTIHALDLAMPFDELPTRYRERPEGSVSKLRTIPDGIKILRFIMVLWRDYRPLRFLGTMAGALIAIALLLVAVLHASGTSWQYAGQAETVAAAAAAAVLLAGVVLDSLGRSRQELKRMLYLSLPTLDYD